MASCSLYICNADNQTYSPSICGCATYGTCTCYEVESITCPSYGLCGSDLCNKDICAQHVCTSYGNVCPCNNSTACLVDACADNPGLYCPWEGYTQICSGDNSYQNMYKILMELPEAVTYSEDYKAQLKSTLTELLNEGNFTSGTVMKTDNSKICANVGERLYMCNNDTSDNIYYKGSNFYYKEIES